MTYVRLRISGLPASAGILVALLVGLALPLLAAAQGKSADDVARELTNPNNDLAKLTFKNQYRWYTGDLPNADDQDNYTLLFQPVFPFTLGKTESGDNQVFFLRPAIPLVVDQPIPDPTQADFWSEETAIGDTSFDAAYAVTRKDGWVFAGGMIVTLPWASDTDVSGGQYRVGPEFLVGKLSKWGLLGVFPYHQWDVAGTRGPKEKRDADYSLTSTQLFVVHNAGNGWTVGTTPIVTYDWESEDWTVPVQLNITKTVLLGASKRPWKFELEVAYYAEQSDLFGPEWLLGFNVTPIVNNFVEDLFRGKK